MNDSAPNRPPADPREEIARRVWETQLKLLDGIERDIANKLLPSPHMEAYEALCRAEATRLAR